MDDVLFPELLRLSDLALFLLRLWIAIIFITSGWSHLTQPRERGESLGMPAAATFVLGAVEVLGSILLVVGLWTQLAAAALIVTMLGATWKKMFVWKTGFWGEESNGWYYDVLYLICNLVILATGGGAIGL
ncbi:MAG: DoxX family protein [Gemmatimonadota bacterium]|nr:DoxX family protein [Gemmatimonadota bacterium]